jgi:hypothetical protein
VLRHPLVEPDAEVARHQRGRLETTVAAELRAAATRLFGTEDPEIASSLDRAIGTPLGLPLFPGVYHLYHHLRGGESRPDGSREATVELGRQAIRYREQRQAEGPRRYAGSLDAEYPASCVQRALAQAPAEMDRTTVTSKLAPWPREEPILDRAMEVLMEAWPAAHAEIDVVLAQVWYLSGHGLVGFTDFTAHGAVFVSDSRAIDTEGIPAAVRLAESLLHEATHTVCNAAAVSQPLVLGSPGGTVTLVPTPLRADQRPLAGLMQQLVVLVRCAGLYERAIEAVGERAALHDRAAVLADQARQAVRTLRRYRPHLTEAGAAVVEAAARRITTCPTAVPTP